MKISNLYDSNACGRCGARVAPTNIYRSKKIGLTQPACGECIHWARQQARDAIARGESLSDYTGKVPEERQETRAMVKPPADVPEKRQETQVNPRISKMKDLESPRPQRYKTQKLHRKELPEG